MTIACETAPLEYASFEEYPYYEGDDLGINYSLEGSVFKLWSPPAHEVKLRIYLEGSGGEATIERKMIRGINGVWETKIEGDINGQYYTYQVNIKGVWLNEVPGPYARAVGVNGKRAMVISLLETNPEGWENDQRPPLQNLTDIIIYELHVRDLSTHPNSGISNKGKFLGLTESGTKSPEGESTGLDHIKELGVTHVHLLPSFDFKSIDETALHQNKFNWGYDPQNYNVPEGSYSTNPNDGATRISEFKKMVQTLHQNDLRVIMDVVYNHTGDTELSNFNQLVPGYYYRQDKTGGFSNASACGNETASERAMMRKFMVESVKYWATEYHIDGFRFDLMGIHDIETMNLITQELEKIDPTIFVYGEGWTAGDSPLPLERRAIKHNTVNLSEVAAFSDDLRDGIKGHWSDHEDQGFASGKPGLEESVKFGVVASTHHPQINYKVVNYSNAPWANQPYQTINYVSCHDNHTLLDKLAISNKEASEEELIRMHKLSIAIVLTSQGIPFLHAGVELLRTKQGEENSYQSHDTINQIDWSRKAQYKPVFEFYRDLISLRKNHPAFRMPNVDMINHYLKFLDLNQPNMVGYMIDNHANGDEYNNILVLFNGSKEERKVQIPEGNWKLILGSENIDEEGLRNISGIQLKIPAVSAYILAET